MNAEIITVGAGLVLGNTANTSGQFLSHELAAFGIEVTQVSAVGADEASVRQALRLALGRSDLVVLAGGLGQEPGGSVLEVVSQELSLPLELHEDSYERIKEYFVNTCRPMPPDAEKQARLPRGAAVFPNDHGTAPGCAVSRYGQQIFLLPGEPRELMPMFSDYVAPYLSNCAGGTIVSRTVGVFGLTEAVLTERLADLMSEANPNVALYAKDGEAILRVTAHAANRADALALCAPVVDEICRRLGVNVYGVDVGSLQKAVVALLLDKQMKIATAESCTAGLLSGRLTEVAGVSSVFECGIAAYSKEIKHNILGVPNETLDRYGAVSPETARDMAVGARRVGSAQLGVGITGVAGPDTSEGKPVGTVYVALADEKRVWVKKIDTKDGAVDREYVRYLAVSHALDLVRRYLEALPTVMAGGEPLLSPAEPVPAEIPEAAVAPPRRKHFLRSVLPWKGDGRAEIIRKCAILAVFLLLIAVAATVLYLYVLQPMNNQRLYNQLTELYDVDNPSVIESELAYAPDGMLSQFNALYARNSDVRGWLKIEGTNINYPVMRGDGQNFYRSHNFDRQYSIYGVPYFDTNAALVSADSVNRSLVIYGNNAGGGQMFSDLTNYYDDLSFLRSHPVIEMNTIYRNAKWKIFSVMVAASPEDGDFDFTRNTFADETDFLGFAGGIRVRSLYSYPDGVVDIQEGDSLLLLATPFSDVAGFDGAYLVVAARQVRDGESETADLGGVTYNSSAVMPGGWKGQSSATDSTSSSRPGGSAITRGTDPRDETSSSSESGGSTTLTEPVSEQPSFAPASGTTAGSTTAPDTSRPSSSSQTTSTTTGRPTTTSTESTTTTNTNGSTGTTSTTSPPTEPNAAVPPVLAGSHPESYYLQYCRVIESGVKIEPDNREELQMLLARIVKTELGKSSTFGTPGTAGYMQAQKAQAIAAYTTILYSNQVEKAIPEMSLKSLDLSNANDRAIYDAVGEVAGIKILSNGSPVYTPYFAFSPGATADNQYVNVLKLPYSGVVSKYDNEKTIRELDAGQVWERVSYTGTREELAEEITAYLRGSNAGYNPEVAFGDAVEVTRWDPYETYPLSLSITYVDKNGVSRQLTGGRLFAALGLRSPAFTVSDDGETVTIRTRGNGHCVGLSQLGAAGYAKYENWDYKRILSHYFSITASSSHRLVAPVW